MSARNQPVPLPAFPTVSHISLDDDGTYPNNAALPLIIYRAVLAAGEGTARAVRPEAVEELFAQFGWGSSWRNGIYSVHHYHSTAHEVLGVYEGRVTVQFGGPAGITTEIAAGDVVVVPAGVAHKNLESSGDFRTIGAYPIGQTWDVCYGTPGERPAADEHIAATALPTMDPVFGAEGPTSLLWR